MGKMSTGSLEIVEERMEFADVALAEQHEVQERSLVIVVQGSSEDDCGR